MQSRTDDALIYDVRYTFDEWGRRKVPGAAAGRPAHLLFFGCSVTFGEGVEDTETMPAQIARMLPSHQPYNYAFSGYGPQQAYALAQRLTAAQVSQRDGALVYVFIDQQVRRAIGALRMFNGWGWDFPRYVIENGELTRKGSFSTSQPMTASIYRALWRSAAVRESGLDWPLRTSARDVSLSLRLLEETSATYRSRFPDNDVYIVIYPTATRHRQAIVEHFAERPEQVLDLSALLDPDPYRFRIHPLDNHPGPAAHRRIAEAIAEAITDRIRSASGEP